MEEFIEAQEHNKQMVKEYIEGQEGVDYVFGDYDSASKTLNNNDLDKLAKAVFKEELYELEKKKKELRGTSKDPEHLRKLEILE